MRNKMTIFGVFLITVVWGMVWGCKQGASTSTQEQASSSAPVPAPTAPSPAPAPTAPSGDAVATEAKQIFDMRCATCHGTSGKGDGAAAAALNPKPRDYSDAAWQKTVTDQQLADVIVKGGAAVGKSNMMPPNPDLGTKPEVVKAIVAMIRGFVPR